MFHCNMFRIHCLRATSVVAAAVAVVGVVVRAVLSPVERVVHLHIIIIIGIMTIVFIYHYCCYHLFIIIIVIIRVRVSHRNEITLRNQNESQF